MPANRHRFATCGHLGRGIFCHRCAQAGKLRDQAKKVLSIDKEKSQKMTVEADRLAAASK